MRCSPTAHFRLSENVETRLQGQRRSAGLRQQRRQQDYGNTGSNLLNGEGGADIMLVVPATTCTLSTISATGVIENLNDGTDVVFSTIDYTLTANVETLVLQGSDNLSGAGNALSNSIHGNAGDNQLNLRAGADVLKAMPATTRSCSMPGKPTATPSSTSRATAPAPATR